MIDNTLMILLSFLKIKKYVYLKPYSELMDPKNMSYAFNMFIAVIKDNNR